MMQREEYRILTSPSWAYRLVSKNEFDAHVAATGAWVRQDWDAATIGPRGMVWAYTAPPASWGSA